MMPVRRNPVYGMKTECNVCSSEGEVAIRRDGTSAPARPGLERCSVSTTKKLYPSKFKTLLKNFTCIDVYIIFFEDKRR